MKTMTCLDMGGPCNFKMTAETPEEMIKKGVEHINTAEDEYHIKIAKQMKTISPKDKKEWDEMFMHKWDML